MMNLLIYMIIQTIFVAIVITIFVIKNKFSENIYNCMKTLFMRYPYLNNVYLIDNKHNISIGKYNKLEGKIYI